MQRIWLRGKCANKIMREASRKMPLETGGILMGYWSGSDVVVMDVIGPGPAASHSLFGFKPDSEWQIEVIAKIYKKSGRRLTYLGDWHTHPLGGNGLSSVDIKTLTRIAGHFESRCPKPIMAILYGMFSWQIAVWHYERFGIRKTNIKLIDDILLF